MPMIESALIIAYRWAPFAESTACVTMVGTKKPFHFYYMKNTSTHHSPSHPQASAVST